MSNEFHDKREHWEELHACDLLFGLTPNERIEFDELTSVLPSSELNWFDKTVAQLDIDAARDERLPDQLRRKIENDAKTELSGSNTPSGSRQGRRSLFLTYIPWFVTAACVLLAIGVWTLSPSPNTSPTDPAQARAELIATAKDLVQVNWSAGPTPVDGSSGDIVWSPKQQRGYMRFKGLRANIPTLEQYQLWVFDKNQSEKTPIDGGVFDINSEGDVVVPVDAKLHVQEATMFAVTLEKPGGVVVSSRERLLFIAKVE